jgi:glycosyltransferase involved in cell wall biosynthesis
MTPADAPLISVVMPCYNTERYIGEAIGSILSQGIESVQIVVIDDGSTDRSADIARGFTGRVECRSQANAGISAARNAGVALARGKYLAFLDADDIWTPGSLRLRLEQLRRGAECVFGGVENFISPDLSEGERDRVGPIPPTMTGRLTGTMLIERRAFDRVGSFDSSLKIGEMFDWVGRAEQAGVATVLIDDIVLRRRVHSNNTTMRLKNEKGDYLKALKGSLMRRREAELKRGGAA